MNEWQVFGVIVALVAFLTAVVKPIIQLNTTVTELTTIVRKLSKDFDDLTNRNAKTHERLGEQIEDHEKRITVLETKG